MQNDLTIKEKVYKQKEAEQLLTLQIVKLAETMWMRLAIDRAAKYGPHRGGSVINAGIKIWILRPRCRIPKMVFLIEAPSAFQSDFYYGPCADQVVKMLQNYGIDCWYCSGRMD